MGGGEVIQTGKAKCPGATRNQSFQIYDVNWGKRWFNTFLTFLLHRDILNLQSLGQSFIGGPHFVFKTV